MLERLKLTQLAAALALLAMPTLADAQDGGRSRVLVPFFEAQQGAERNFGEQATEDLREMMQRLPFHVAVSEDEMEDMADRFRVDVEDIDCLQGMQLAAQVNIPILICGSYTQDAQRNFTLNASIRTVQTQENFQLPVINVPRNGRQQAAQQIYEQFERYNTVIRSAQICQDYVNSQQWESALRNCNESLAINPDALTIRALRAGILVEMDSLPQALEDFDRVLEQDPLNEIALQTAGVIATQMGEDERGRGYFRRYLEVNPGNVAIRLRIASQMADAKGTTLSVRITGTASTNEECTFAASGRTITFPGFLKVYVESTDEAEPDERRQEPDHERLEDRMSECAVARHARPGVEQPDQEAKRARRAGSDDCLVREITIESRLGCMRANHSLVVQGGLIRHHFIGTVRGMVIWRSAFSGP